MEQKLSINTRTLIAQKTYYQQILPALSFGKKALTVSDYHPSDQDIARTYA